MYKNIVETDLQGKMLMHGLGGIQTDNTIWTPLWKKFKTWFLKVNRYFLQ